MADILLFEDDVRLAMDMAMFLGDLGHEVAVFHSYDAAIDHIQSNPVDLVIADLFVMKDDAIAPNGGITLIHFARVEKKIPIPSIAMSAAFDGPSEHAMRATAQSVGADRIMAKPFDMEELELNVAALLSAPNND